MAEPKNIYIVKTPYTLHYKEDCFSAWYAAGRPDKFPDILRAIPKDEHGRKPVTLVLRGWRDKYFWDVRADDLDAKASNIIEDELVSGRVMMLKEQASRGRELQVKGLDFIRIKGFDTSASAISAVFKGADLERISRGLSQRLVRLANIDDDKLLLEIAKAMEEAVDSGEILDMEEVEDTDGEDT